MGTFVSFIQITAIYLEGAPYMREDCGVTYITNTHLILKESHNGAVQCTPHKSLRLIRIVHEPDF